MSSGGFPELPFGSPEDLLFSWNTLYFISFIVIIIWFRGYMNGCPCYSKARLKGKTAIVTGANSGIGKEVAKDLASRGARVILACRDEKNGRETENELKRISKKVQYMHLDLASFDSIREFVETFKNKESSLDILVNNAGIMMAPQGPTENGHEMHFGVNYLGPFLLTNLLLDTLKASAPSRVVCLSATAYRMGSINLHDLDQQEAEYKPGNAYSASKLAVMLFVRKLSQILEGTKVTVNVVHPGVVRTNAHRNMPFMANSFLRFSFFPVVWMLLKTAHGGAQTVLHCAVAEELESTTGKYFIDCEEKEIEPVAKDDDVMESLWNKSLTMVNLDKSD